MKMQVVFVILISLIVLSMSMVVAEQSIKGDDPLETSFEGIVYDKETGDPITYARVSVLDEESNLMKITYTDENGYYYTEFYQGGNYQIFAETEDHYQETHNCIVRFGERTEHDFELESKEIICQIYGSVVDEVSGESLSDVFVSVYILTDISGPFIQYQSYAYTYTDLNGDYSVNIDHEGDFRVKFEKYGYDEHYPNEAYKMEIGDELRIDAKLDPWDRGVSGIVVDSYGNPMSEVIVTLEQPWGQFNCETDENGLYEIIVPNSGQHSLKAHVDGYRPYMRRVQVKTNTISEVKIRMESSVLPPPIYRLMMTILEIIGIF